MNIDHAAAHVLVKGRVQGVGYRYFAQDTAEARGLKGWVRNIPGTDVECDVEGNRSEIEAWLNELRKGPPLARVEDVQVSWKTPSGQYPDFSIRS
jgi:acylphosphatase